MDEILGKALVNIVDEFKDGHDAPKAYHAIRKQLIGHGFMVMALTLEERWQACRTYEDARWLLCSVPFAVVV